MLLVIEAVINPSTGCYERGYEDAFEVLNEMVCQGFELLAATMEDEHSQLNIPVEAFDG